MHENCIFTTFTKLSFSNYWPSVARRPFRECNKGLFPAFQPQKNKKNKLQKYYCIHKLKHKLDVWLTLLIT